MTTSKMNIIQKQILNLHYKGKEDGFALQKEVTDWYYRELYPELQAMMEELAPANVHVRFDKLKIDLVIKRAGDWKQALRKQAVESLRNQLQQGVHYSEPVETNVVITPAENFFLLLTHYLQEGYLPWWTAIKSKNDFDETLEEWLLTDESLKHIAGMKAILPEKNVVVRIARFDDNIFDGFIKLLTGSDSFVQGLQQFKKDAAAISELLPPAKKGNMIGLLKQVIIEYVTKEIYDLKAIAIAFANRSAANFADELKNIEPSVIRTKQLKEAIFIRGKEKNIFQRERSLASGKKETAAKKKDDKNIIEQEQPSALKQKEMAEQEDEKHIKGEDPLVSIDKTTKQTETKPGEKDEFNDVSKKRSRHTTDLKDGLFVHNAGLVIVAGFLPMFFKKLLLDVENGKTNINKAAMLVQYLASGKDNIAEFELGLAKILCGLEMDTPVDTTILLTAEEKEEANELLLSAIEYWSILKDTSVEGLRDSFLLRDGKLSFSNNEWLLQVEQKSYDMLLQQLPWNISRIKLSWMKNLLKTEWVY